MLVQIRGTWPNEGLCYSYYGYGSLKHFHRSHEGPHPRGIIRTVLQYYGHGNRLNACIQRGCTIGIREADPVIEVHEYARKLDAGTWLSLPETHAVFRDNRPTGHLCVTVLCDNRVSVRCVKFLEAEELAVFDVLESPKTASVLREYPL